MSEAGKYAGAAQQERRCFMTAKYNFDDRSVVLLLRCAAAAELDYSAVRFIRLRWAVPFRLCI